MTPCGGGCYSVTSKNNLYTKVIFPFFLIEAAALLLSFLLIQFFPTKLYGPYVVLWAAMTALQIFFFTLYQRKIISNVATLYLLTVSVLAVCYIFMMPIYVWGGDNQVHFSRTLEMAQTYSTKNYGAYSTFLEKGSYSLENVLKRREAANVDRMLEYKSSVCSLPNLKHIAYLPGIIGITIADALNLSPHVAFYMGQLCSTFLAIFLIYSGLYSGLKKLRSGQMILMIFATLPNIFRLICIYSYNNWIFPWAFYAVAYVIGEMQSPDKKMTIRDTICILGAFLLAFLPKSPYFILISIAFLVPSSKFETCKKYKHFRLLVLLTMLILMFQLVAPILFEGGLGVYSDKRGGSDVSAMGQALFILQHPIRYTHILLHNLIELFAPSYAVFGSIGLMMLRTYQPVPYLLSVPMVLLLLFAIFKDHSSFDSYIFTLPKRRCILLGTCFLAIWITTVMYMNYTTVGNSTIDGMNPLYVTGFIFPALFCLGIRKKNRPLTRKRFFNIGVWGLYCGLMQIAIFEMLVRAVIV